MTKNVDDKAPTEAKVAIRAAHESGNFERAATLLLETYGGEIGGYLAATLRDATDAADAFSQFQEDLWRGLPAFDFRASARTWAYVLARHAAYRLGRPAYRRRERPANVYQSDLAQHLVAQVRTQTARYLKTESKDKVAALREQLSPAERELLVLRVDRQLSWTDLARVLPSDEANTNDADADADATGTALTLDDAALKKRAATLRKRFERAKAHLRTLAEDAGLLS